MSAAEHDLGDLLAEIDAVDDDPELPDSFRELDVLDDSALYEGPRTVFYDANSHEAYVRVASKHVLDLQEVR